MPPKKPLSSRAQPESRRGRPAGRPLDEEEDDEPKTQRGHAPFPEELATDEDWEAPPGRMSGEYPVDEPEYSTGADYGAEELAEDLPADSGTFNGLDEEGRGTFDEDPDRDIYGENEYPPDEEEYVAPEGDDDEPSFQSHTETRVAAEDEPPEQDEENTEATRAGPPIKLEIIAGPDEGKVKRLSRVRMVIGRVSGCELVLSDQSVSRRHVELVQGERGVLLRDLGSGNGTKVNGERVTERILQHEDEIAIGKTRFRYLDEMAAFRRLREADLERERQEKEAAAEGAEQDGEGEGQAEGGAEESGAALAQEADPEDPRLRATTAPSIASVPVRRKQKLTKGQRIAAIGGGVALVLLLGVIGVMVATRKPPPPPVDPKKEQAALAMQQARDAVREERFEEAVKLVEEAEALVPGSDADGLLGRATAEMGAQKSLELIRALAEQARFADARAELERFPAASDKRQQEKAKLAAEIDQQEAEHKARRVEELLSTADVDTAKQLVAELPPEKQKELEPKLREVEKERQAQQRAAAQREAAERRSKAAEARAAREAEIDAAFSAVARKFNAAEYQRASAECDRVIDANRGDAEIRARARLLQQLIPTFGRNFEEGHRKFKAGQLASSVRPLRKARELYQQIGFSGPLGAQIDEELAAAALAAGKEALARDDLATAAINFRDAARLDPGDPRAREGLDRVSGKADELYTAAYMIRDRDPREAIAKFRLVMEITPAGTTLHEKAKNQLAALQP